MAVLSHHGGAIDDAVGGGACGDPVLFFAKIVESLKKPSKSIAKNNTRSPPTFLICFLQRFC